ncbi:hypothetical protein HYR54_04850 [Candidatus Acetothermia bacterium]|nr:hypothetical protein [Candidatus Acetothermia bacterium]MBI3461083.1 hypothetical protein [Candidatus Acetothermia bacterium]
MQAEVCKTDRTFQPNLVFALLLGNFTLIGITIGVQGVLWAELMSALLS